MITTFDDYGARSIGNGPGSRAGTSFAREFSGSNLFFAHDEF